VDKAQTRYQLHLGVLVTKGTLLVLQQFVKEKANFAVSKHAGGMEVKKISHLGMANSPPFIAAARIKAGRRTYSPRLITKVFCGDDCFSLEIGAFRGYHPGTQHSRFPPYCK